MNEHNLLFSSIIALALLITLGCSTQVVGKPDGKNNTPNLTSIPPVQNSDVCKYDSDCVAEPVCHPSNCVLKTSITKAGEGNGLICTEQCVPGTLDCGQGECKCIQSKCTAIITG